METNFKGTPGVVTMPQTAPEQNNYGAYGTDLDIGNVPQSITIWHKTKYPDNEELANAELIIDAFKVRQDINVDLPALLEQRDALFAALTEALHKYKQFADSGDAGFWDCEKEDFYSKGVKALNRVRANYVDGQSNANAIKKALYKEKPVAKRVTDVRPPIGFTIYKCNTTRGTVKFKIPVDEANDFKDQEPAQLLIRWLV